jgi:hypothetical protein
LIDSDDDHDAYCYDGVDFDDNHGVDFDDNNDDDIKDNDNIISISSLSPSLFFFSLH